MKILGIDPGYDRCGVAIIESQNNKHTLLYSACIQTNKTDSFSTRLKVVGNTVRELISAWKPDAFAVEQLFFFKNQKTAFLVAELRGVVVYEGAQAGIPFYEYTPLEIKETVAGHGRATKQELAKVLSYTIPLPKHPTLDDEIDAIACAFTCLFREKHTLST
jgi:crossover junction endodeoxyribonuclease RuvC